MFDTYEMAKELGFYVLPLYSQYLPKIDDIAPDKLSEVVTELRTQMEYSPTDYVHKPALKNITERLGPSMLDRAQRWRETVDAARTR